jgi:hypothetical protein
MCLFFRIVCSFVCVCSCDVCDYVQSLFCFSGFTHTKKRQQTLLLTNTNTLYRRPSLLLSRLSGCRVVDRGDKRRWSARRGICADNEAIDSQPVVIVGVEGMDAHVSASRYVLLLMCD